MVNHLERESTSRLRRQCSPLNTSTPEQILSLRALVVADLANELIQHVPGYAAPGLQLIRSEMESIGFDVLDLEQQNGPA